MSQCFCIIVIDTDVVTLNARLQLIYAKKCHCWVISVAHFCSAHSPSVRPSFDVNSWLQPKRSFTQVSRTLTSISSFILGKRKLKPYIDKKAPKMAAHQFFLMKLSSRRHGECMRQLSAWLHKKPGKIRESSGYLSTSDDWKHVGTIQAQSNENGANDQNCP